MTPEETNKQVTKSLKPNEYIPCVYDNEVACSCDSIMTTKMVIASFILVDIQNVFLLVFQVYIFLGGVGHFSP